MARAGHERSDAALLATNAWLALINPGRLTKPFDHPGWLFELKFDGFRAAADAVHGRLISRNGNQMHRFDRVLDLLPKGCVFDGELVVLDDAGRPLFDELLFARRRPTYVAFDLLFADGTDLRSFVFGPRAACDGCDAFGHLQESVPGVTAGLRDIIVRFPHPMAEKVAPRNSQTFSTGFNSGV